MLQGSTTVSTGAEIGPETQLADCTVGPGAVVTATIGRMATIGADARVGPWAWLPPGSRIDEGAVTGACFTGNTVEDEG
jgi:bifunctional UDP-N-acetylglucosamine pyrophosphorylase/glucosamine-1-phosphate N-acetyltransferase